MSPYGVAPVAAAPQAYCRTAAAAAPISADVQAQASGTADRFRALAAADRATDRDADSAIGQNDAPALAAHIFGSLAVVAETVGVTPRSEDAAQSAGVVATRYAAGAAGAVAANFAHAAGPEQASLSAPE